MTEEARTEEVRTDRRRFLRQLMGRGAVAAAGATVATGLLAEGANAAHDATNIMHVGVTNTGIATTTTLSGSQFNAVNGNASRSITASHTLGSAIAVEATSNTGAPLRLVSDGGSIAMPPTTNTWEQGSMRVDGDGDIWYCWEGGAGSDSSWYPLSLIPAFIPLAAPQRIYLSSTTSPFTKITNGQERTISSLTGGHIPPTAFAVLFNLAVISTTGTSGFLAAFAADVVYPGHSNINWFGTNQIIANTVVTATDVNGDFKIRCGSNSAGTHFVIDALGFYTLTA
ncbi:MAG: hypothetical protein WD598_01865 [Acidimicrobiia bacterium]